MQGPAVPGIWGGLLRQVMSARSERSSGFSQGGKRSGLGHSRGGTACAKGLWCKRPEMLREDISPPVEKGFRLLNGLDVPGPLSAHLPTLQKLLIY